jgi:hypothetical protein
MWRAAARRIWRKSANWRSTTRRSRSADNIKFFFGGLDSSVRSTHKCSLTAIKTKHPRGGCLAGGERPAASNNANAGQDKRNYCSQKPILRTSGEERDDDEVRDCDHQRYVGDFEDEHRGSSN